MWARSDAEGTGCGLLHTRSRRVGWRRGSDGAGVVHPTRWVEGGHRVAGPINLAVTPNKDAVVQTVAGWYGRGRIDLPAVVEPPDLNLRRIFNVEVQSIGRSGASGGVELYGGRPHGFAKDQETDTCQ